MQNVIPDNSNGDALDTQVRADKIRLLFHQSYQAVFSTIVVAGLWVTLLWQHASHSNLMIWLGLLAVATLGRILLFLQYQRHSTDTNVLKWIAPYTLTVLASALVWGLGTVWAMPSNSFLYQSITYVFLIGLAGAALSAYGVFRGMTIAIVCAVILPCTIFFLLSGERDQLVLGLSGIWFFLTTLRAVNVHNKSVEQSFLKGHQLEAAKRIAEQQARTDPLTGLNNRRAFTDMADTLLRLGLRDGRTSSIMLIDIDDFKRINDNHGHAMGDAALLHISRLLMETMRKSDVCGRHGGDEFAVLLSNTELNAAKATAEKLIQALVEQPLPAGGTLPLTLSIGIASDAYDSETLLQHADSAMYQAKRNGKNRIELYTTS